MTAKAWNPRPDVWLVFWSDGDVTLEKCEADARMCEKFPNLCHPDAWAKMLEESR